LRTETARVFLGDAEHMPELATDRTGM